MMLYALGDCLDGAVARQCDKQSKMGYVLDTVADHANMFLHAYMFLILVLGIRPHIWTTVLMYAITLWFKLGYVSTHMDNPLFTMLHDNTFLSFFVYWLLVYNNLK
jgi:phosphatidylglycerophosphate synthase